jgi:hypothetical protein
MFAKLTLTCGATTANPSPSISEPRPQVSSAADTRPARLLRRGNSPISRVPRPSMPIVPSSVMTDTAAEP